MRNIKIAVLDSGVSDELSKSIQIVNRKEFCWDYYEDAIVTSDNIADHNGHGTMCIDTMLTVFEHIEFSIIKMLNVSGVASEAVFIEALKYAGTLDVDIIAVCASLTMNKNSDQLYKMCRKISESGKVIVASVENGKTQSAPAFYDCVIGVLGGTMEDTTFRFSSKREIQMQCSSEATITMSAFGQRSVFQGNSRAAALATAHIAKMMYDNTCSMANLDEAIAKEAESSQFIKKKYDAEYDEYMKMRFDNRKESQLIKTDADYHRFIYALCEFFLCDDPQYIRRQQLIDFQERYILRRMEYFLCYVEDKFNVRLTSIKLRNFQWAYLFYEKYIKKESECK